jgi:sulfane dehydrogenase subunit SoxC
MCAPPFSTTHSADRSGAYIRRFRPTRRVTNVRWGGIDLAHLLRGLQINAAARFLWSYGLDGGDFSGTSCDWFIKDLPLARLAAGDVLIAYELNDAPLPTENGFPARLVVPGYYGTNNVKWLWRLHLADHRAEGPFTTMFYNDRASAADCAAGLPSRNPVWALAPESLIVAPKPDATLRAGESVEICGWAWSFRGIDHVEVSVDGGASYRRATLEDRCGWAWQRFSLPWTPVERGKAWIQVRAIDATGTAQPQDGARNAIHTVPITVQ